MAIYSYFWAFSTISKVTLTAGTTYNIEAFPVQSDQPSPAWGWREPQRKGTKRPRYPAYPQNMDLSVSPQGLWEFTWCMPPMTPGMFAYIIANQFSSGTLWSAPATVQTYDENVNGYSAFQVTALRPIPEEHYTIQDEKYIDVLYRFVGGTLL